MSTGRTKTKKHLLRKGGTSLVRGIVLCVIGVGLCFFVKTELDTYRTTLQNQQKTDQLMRTQAAVQLTIEEKQAMEKSIASGKGANAQLLKILRARGYVYPDEIVYYDVTRSVNK